MKQNFKIVFLIFITFPFSYRQKKLTRNCAGCSPFKRQFHKMVKHTQTISRQIADELFECVWPFCGIGT